MKSRERKHLYPQWFLWQSDPGSGNTPTIRAFTDDRIWWYRPLSWMETVRKQEMVLQPASCNPGNLSILHKEGLGAVGCRTITMLSNIPASLYLYTLTLPSGCWHAPLFQSCVMFGVKRIPSTPILHVFFMCRGFWSRTGSMIQMLGLIVTIIYVYPVTPGNCCQIPQSLAPLPHATI